MIWISGSVVGSGEVVGGDSLGSGEVGGGDSSGCGEVGDGVVVSGDVGAMVDVHAESG